MPKPVLRGRLQTIKDQTLGRLDRPGVILTRSQLLDHARGAQSEAFDRAIDSHVKNLRRKLAELLPLQPCIHSVYGVGYRFEWVVEAQS